MRTFMDLLKNAQKNKKEMNTSYISVNPFSEIPVSEINAITDEAREENLSHLLRKYRNTYAIKIERTAYGYDLLFLKIE